MVEEKRKELFTAYQKWETELMEKCPELINKQYSHPYYLHIPDDWYESQYRILIVGEEGHGEKTFNLPIEEAQEFNRDFLLDQLNNEGKHLSVTFFHYKHLRSVLSAFPHIPLPACVHHR